MINKSGWTTFEDIEVGEIFVINEPDKDPVPYLKILIGNDRTEKELAVCLTEPFNGMVFAFDEDYKVLPANSFLTINSENSILTLNDSSPKLIEFNKDFT